MVKNVLILGANGFIGKCIVKEFLNNYNVTAADLSGSFKQKLDYETVEVNITVPSTLEDVVKNKDIVVNAAGLVDLSADKSLLFDVNVHGVKNLCEMVAKHNVEKFVQISSIGVYGNSKVMPVTEYCKKSPKNNYEVSKYLGELLAFSYNKNFKVIVLRPAAVYGTGSLHNAVLPLFNMKKRKKVLCFKNGPKLSHVHVEDVARAVLHLVEHDCFGAYNLADDKPITTFEMFKALLEPMGLEVKPVLPYSKLLARLIKGSAQILPAGFYDKLNKKLLKKWLKFCQANNLTPELRPRLDPVWLDYLVHDKVYSNRKIKQTGFEFKWPDPVIGLNGLVEYYLENNLLLKR